MKKNLFAVFVMAMIIAFAGCAGKKVDQSASELAAEGSRYFEKGDYSKAIESYKRIVDRFPWSHLAREAQLRVADGHYHLEEYEEAIFAYEQFMGLHPEDPKLPYVIYQIGLSHYERLRTVDRTQVPARNALNTFELLQARFPASEYAKKADPLMEKCLENLAGHEFYVGRFYYRSGHYKAAINRFRKVVEQFPGHLEVQKEAMNYLELAENRLSEQDDEPIEIPETFPRETDRPLEEPLITPGPEPSSSPIPEH